ncbi:MAG: hypothetical protein IPF96_10605 [Rhodobacter sp.]|nr:hypothetical protein [Rhodobacter sp.]
MIPAPTPKARLALLLSVTLGLPVAALAQDDTPARSPADTALLSTIAGMDFGKQSAVYDRLGFDPGPEFWNCVCRAAAYGSSSASQVFHPDTIGTYDDRYSCNHPGDPCVVSGFGCMRYPLPSDPALWEGCAAEAAAKGGANPLDTLVAAAKSGGGLGAAAAAAADGGAKPGKEECALRRTEALSQPGAGRDRLFRDVPADKDIYVISQEMAELMKDRVKPTTLEDAIIAAGEFGIWTGDFLLRRPELLKPDQVDLRVDVSPEGMGGGFEIGFGLDKEGRVEPQEIVLKMEAVKGGPNAEIGIGIGLQDGDWTKPEFNGKYKLGFSADGIDVGPVSLEGKYGISVDTALSTDDFYDGEWQTKSEYRVVRWVEDGVTQLDFYVGGAAGLGDGQANVGLEASWGLRDRYTAGVFDEMTTALDSLLDNQKAWEDHRHAMIEEEAKAWGIDTACMYPGEMIAAVRAAHEEKLRKDPTTPPPFEKLLKTSRERRN